ncbi:MAG: glycosyltransferase family 87 protein [Bryobacteraceae bacterium]
MIEVHEAQPAAGLRRPREEWLRRILGPPLNVKELNVICWGLFLIGLLLPLCVVAAFQKQVPDSDFVYFYSMGRILNEYPAERVYEYGLQQQVCTEVHPLKDAKYGPIPYPPFVGTLFRPLALLPYPMAYAIWLGICLTLYVAGIMITTRRYFPEDPARRSLILCLALSFFSFTFDTFVNGQLSAIGFFALALAMQEEDRSHPFLSGLAIAACLYKPPLLLLILPMLVVTRRFRALLGCAVGAAALGLFTLATEGTRVWAGYGALLLHFGQGATGLHGQSFLRLRKYVDFTSFSSLVAGGRSWVGLVLIYGYSCWAAVTLIRFWWNSAKAHRSVGTLIWMATITWTLLLNVYVPRYDSILVALSIIGTSGVWTTFRDTKLSRWFTAIWLLILASSWITEEIALASGIQVLTLLIAALGMVQFSMLRTAMTLRRMSL